MTTSSSWGNLPLATSSRSLANLDQAWLLHVHLTPSRGQSCSRFYRGMDSTIVCSIDLLYYYQVKHEADDQRETRTTNLALTCAAPGIPHVSTTLRSCSWRSREPDLTSHWHASLARTSPLVNHPLYLALRKWRVVFLIRCEDTDMAPTIHLLGCLVIEFPFSYMGLPLTIGRPTAVQSRNFIENMSNGRFVLSTFAWL
jgi:hypothetical protein